VIAVGVVIGLLVLCTSWFARQTRFVGIGVRFGMGIVGVGCAVLRTGRFTGHAGLVGVGIRFGIGVNRFVRGVPGVEWRGVLGSVRIGDRLIDIG
jgi:hypothetical protein